MQDWNNAGHTPNDDDDDLNFDWLDEEAEKGKPSSPGEGHTGVTGQLDWQHFGDEASDDDAANADDDTFDWQAGSKNPAKPVQPDQTGLTGSLDWQRASRPSDTGGAEDDDQPEWQSAPPARAFGDTGQLMDWMTTLDEDSEASPPPVPEDTFDFDSGFPDSELDSSAEDDDYGTPPLPASSGDVGDLPDWLADLDVPDASDEDIFAAQQSVLGSSDGDWMTEDAPGDSYDYAPQDEYTDGDSQPDWMQDIPDFGTGDAEQGYAQDEYSDEGAYDPNAPYYADETQYEDGYAYGEAGSDAAYAVEDTGQGFEDYQATPKTPSTDDLFGEFDDMEFEPTAEEDVSLDDLLTEATPQASASGTDELSLDDLLGEITMDADDLSLDDLLADLDSVGTSAASEPQPNFDAGEFDFDSIAALDDADAAPAAQADLGDFDFDSIVGLDEADVAPVAQAGLDDFDFDATPETVAADEFDFDSIIVLDEADAAPVAQADLGDFDFDDMPAAVPAEDDDLSWLDAAHDTPAEVGVSASAEDEDWLQGDGSDDFADFFADEPDETALTGEEADYVQSIVQPTTPDGDVDWYGDKITPTDADAEPNWLDSLQDVDMEAILAAERPAPRLEPKSAPKPPPEAEIDLDALLAESPNAPVRPSSFNTGDLNAFLDDDSPAEPIQYTALPSDLEAFFAETRTSRDLTTESSEDQFDVPDWLREAVSSADVETSAAALIRQQKDRPIDDLDDRLRSLRESGLNIKVERPEAAPAALPGVKEGLVPVTVKPVTETGLDAALRLSPEQQKRARTLLKLVGIDTAGAVGRVELDEEGEIITEAALDTAQKARPQRQRRRWLQGMDYRLIALLLLAAVLLPFFVNIRIGDTPPVVFPPGSEGAAAFIQMETVAPGSRVLIATEYGAAGASELDELTRALLTHTLLQGAQPVIVSSNPTGLLHGDTLISSLAGESNRNNLYFVTGYLVGESVGLRDLTQNPALHFASDSNGAPTNLTITSLDDFAVIVLITDDASSARAWMEQVVVLTRTPVIIASSYSAMPLVIPYARSLPNVTGLLVGYKDAYTYNTALIAGNPQAVIATSEPTTEPTIAPTEVIAPIVTQETTAIPTEQPTTVTVGTALPPPDATVTQRPTATATQVVTIEVVAVAGPDPINVREDANTGARIAGELQPGERVAVIAYSPARDWINVILSDGTEAWVAAFLVRVEQIPQGQFTGQLPRRDPRSARANDRIHAGVRVAQVAETPTAVPELVLTPVALDNTSVVTIQRIPQGEERWTAMTLGILAAIVIILLGNLYNLMRWLVQRDN
jgi:hypothetical protein